MRKRRTGLPAALLALVLLLTACGRQGDTPGDGAEEEPFTLTVRVTGAQDTLDPAKNTAQGGETILYHLFENLLRWEDNGNGWAELAPGQAESWTVDTDYAGNATYTFTLREGIQWSDSQPVTAEDFVTAWRRLADPAAALPYRTLLSVVAGYDQVQETGDTSLLAVSAPDERTFVVSLNGSCAYFLSDLCAGAHTMPVRADLADNGAWGASAYATATNGPYTASRLTSGLVTMERSKTYYDRVHVGPERLQFSAMEGAESDYGDFLSGEVDLVAGLPGEIIEELAEADEDWIPDPVTSVYGVMLNTQQPPFDDPAVRLAFRLAVDTQAVTDSLGSRSARPAVGLVPYGVADYGERSDELEEEAEADSDAAAEETPDALYWDFRAHSLEKVTLPAEDDYEADCQQARTLLAQAGYPGGSGFPAVTYLYVNSNLGQAVARSLQAMWREQLGVSVTLRGLSQEEYDTALLPAAQPEDGTDEAEETEETVEETETPAEPFMMAAQSFTAGRGDAGALLSLWHSGKGENLSGYASAAFDILLDSAAAAVSAEARDAYLHDAEAILMDDAPVIPVCYAGGAFRLSESLTGLFRAPDGVYFLTGVKKAPEAG